MAADHASNRLAPKELTVAGYPVIGYTTTPDEMWGDKWT